MVKSALFSTPLIASAASRNPTSGPTDASEPPSSPSASDDDSLGISDPFLDALPSLSDSDVDNDNAPSRDFDVDELRTPRDLGALDEDHDTLEVPLDLLAEEKDAAHSNEDEPGPDIFEALTVLESSDDSVMDGAEEGPVEAPFALPADNGGPLDRDDAEGDELSPDSDTLYVDDTVLTWAREHWTERNLEQAFSARRHLALVGSILAAAGDTTHLLDTKNNASIEEIPLSAKTTRILALDPEAKGLLLLTATGQLLQYQRRGDGTSPEAPKLLLPSMVSGLWQLAPGVPSILIQCENGQLYDFVDSALERHSTLVELEGAKPLALSCLGEPRVSLWKGARGLALLAEAPGDTQRIPLPSAIRTAVTSERPLLVGFNESVLVGVRDHGLWISRAGSREFQPVPGCRNLTAITAGHLGQRPMAFVGLFSELDERAEIALVDLATGRATRIAELSIHSDFVGPEDDPPELARIDSLVWDANRSRLWAAGAFGLALFTPPVSPRAS